MLDRDDLRLVRAPNPSPMTERGTNSWIVGRGEVAIIDPGPDDPRHLAALLGALGPAERVAAIVVTHAHRDHSGLAPALSRATAAPVLAFGAATDGMRPAMSALRLSGLEGGEGVDTAFRPDRTIRDGDSVAGPGWELEVLHTPGHLSNHLCLAFGPMVFTGDHVMGWSTSIVSPPDGDMRAYMDSLERLARRRWSVLLPGHGPVVEDPAHRLHELMAHRRQREAAILEALRRAPASAATLARALYTQTPAPLMPAAERNVLAHLLDLMERNQVATGDATGVDALFQRS